MCKFDTLLDLICKPDMKGAGGVCVCTNDIAAIEGKWGNPYCIGSKCVMRHPYEKCKESLLDIERTKWIKFVDGTYCYKEFRYTDCPMTNNNGNMLLNIVIMS